MVNIFNTVATSNALTPLINARVSLRDLEGVEGNRSATLCGIVAIACAATIVFDKYSNVRLFTRPKFPFALSPTSPYIVHQ